MRNFFKLKKKGNENVKHLPLINGTSSFRGDDGTRHRAAAIDPGDEPFPTGQVVTSVPATHV
jgi:hypothetical protein